MPDLSVFDLVPITQGSTPETALLRFPAPKPRPIENYRNETQFESRHYQFGSRVGPYCEKI